MTHIGGTVYEVNVKVGNGVSANADPVQPTGLAGPTDAVLDDYNNFKASSTDPDSDELYYQFDWGNGSMSTWIGPYASGDSCTIEYAWDTNGDYDVKVRTKDIWDATTDWSPLHSVSVGCCIADRGNADGGPDDGTLTNSVDISDLVFIVAFSFQGGQAPVCVEEADMDGSGGPVPVDISDIVALVAFMFQGGAPPVPCP